jgi:hypothetical protein
LLPERRHGLGRELALPAVPVTKERPWAGWRAGPACSACHQRDDRGWVDSCPYLSCLSPERRQGLGRKLSLPVVPVKERRQGLGRKLSPACRACHQRDDRGWVESWPGLPCLSPERRHGRGRELAVPVTCQLSCKLAKKIGDKGMGKDDRKRNTLAPLTLPNIRHLPYPLSARYYPPLRHFRDDEA